MLELPDGRIHYTSEGDGPPIVMLHAGVADGRMWDKQVAAFHNDFQIVRPDLRGFGQSPLPDGEFANHDDILALVDALGLEQFWLAGASFGGLIALDFTLAYPERVTGLILAAPSVSGATSVELAAFGEEEEALYDAGKLEEASWLNVRMWVDGPQRGPDVVDPAVRQLVYEMQLEAFHVPEPENVSVRRLDPPAIGRLAEIEVPVLIFSGALDVDGPIARSETLTAEIPQARRIVVPDAGHLVSLEKPEMFNSEMRTFIAANP